MTDLRALTDAFTELERRADAHTELHGRTDAAHVTQLPTAPSRPRGVRPSARLVPVAAAVAVVAGLAATGVVLLAPGSDSGGQVATPPVTGSTPVSPTSAAPQRTLGPSTPEDLIERFRAVLGDTATFTVTDRGPGAVIMTMPPAPSGALPSPGVSPASPGSAPTGSQPELPPGSASATPQPRETVGSSIVGTLTAAGVTGGFDLTVYPTDGDGGMCVEGCAPTIVLPDGSKLTTGQFDLEGPPNGITRQVELVRPDGLLLEMHVSNQRSPKGASELLSPHPPLTIEQMTAILTSDRW